MEFRHPNMLFSITQFSYRLLVDPIAYLAIIVLQQLLQHFLLLSFRIRLHRDPKLGHNADNISVSFTYCFKHF